jgi:phosphopantetheinyl transferase
VAQYPLHPCAPEPANDQRTGRGLGNMALMSREALLLVNSLQLQDTDLLQAPALQDDLISAQRHYRPLRRQQFVASRRLLRDQLAVATGVPAARWRITAEANGRPVVVGPGRKAGPDVSLSHSGSRVAAAVARKGRIGVDLETAREGRPFQAMAEAALSPAEQDLVARHGEPAFLRFWTLREAIGKAKGGGFESALALDGTRLVDVGRHPVVADIEGTPYALAHCALVNGSLAVAWMLTDAIRSPTDHLMMALRDDRLGFAIVGC